MECFSPAEAYEVSYDKHSKEIRIYAPSNKIYNRGCTLGGVSITLRIGVALPGVFRIRLSHFEGRNGHELTYILRESKEELDYTIGDGIEIRSDGAVLKVSPEMNITLIQDGNVVTTILSKDMMYVRANGFGDAYITNEDVNYMSAGTNLSVGESIYGLGEQFGPFIKNGQSVAM